MQYSRNQIETIEMIKNCFSYLSDVPTKSFNFITSNDRFGDVAKGNDFVVVKDKYDVLHHIKIYDLSKSSLESKGFADILSNWILTNIMGNKLHKNKISFFSKNGCDLLLSDSPKLLDKNGGPLNYVDSTNLVAKNLNANKLKSRSDYIMDPDHIVRSYLLSIVLSVGDYGDNNVQYYEQNGFLKAVQFDGMLGRFDNTYFENFLRNIIYEVPLLGFEDFTQDQLKKYRDKHGILDSSPILKQYFNVKKIQRDLMQLRLSYDYESTQLSSLVYKSENADKLKKNELKLAIKEKKTQVQHLKEETENLTHILRKVKTELLLIAGQKLISHKEYYLNQVRDFVNSDEFKKNISLVERYANQNAYIRNNYRNSETNPFLNLNRTLNLVESRFLNLVSVLEKETKKFNRLLPHSAFIPNYEQQCIAKSADGNEAGVRFDKLDLHDKKDRAAEASSSGFFKNLSTLFHGQKDSTANKKQTNSLQDTVLDTSF